MAIRRVTVVVLAAAIEAIIIASVVLSTIGMAPGVHPTPNGQAQAGALPAPALSR